MNTYEVEVHIKVQVEAYDENDAKEIIVDTFGPGEECGVTILTSSIRTIQET